MSAKRIGFIGCGNMARAMIGGMLGAGLVQASDIVTSNASQKSAQSVARDLGVEALIDNKKVAQTADVLFLSVKPQKYEAVIAEVAPLVSADTVVVTIAPGKTLNWIEQQFAEGRAELADAGTTCQFKGTDETGTGLAVNESAAGSQAALGATDDVMGGKQSAGEGVADGRLAVKVIRTMPNTPALVGEGVTAYCANAQVSAEELAYVEALLGSFGHIQHVSESLMDAASAVSGSGPAFVYQFIESLADGGVAEGLPREVALKLAAQTVLGSAKMVLETKKHPGQLKDEVCSPGGSTIKGVEVLEECGLRGAVIQAVRTTADAARAL